MTSIFKVIAAAAGLLVAFLVAVGAIALRSKLDGRGERLRQPREVGEPPTPLLHLINYDAASDQFRLLFLHGTSDANIPRISEEGLRRPDMTRVLDAVLSTRPDLTDRSLFETARNDVLGVNARAARVNEKIEFAAWLANAAGIERANDYERVALDGGEVFTITWNRASRLAREQGLGEIPHRFKDARPAILFFYVPFTPGMSREELPRTQDDRVIEISSRVRSGSVPDYPIEVAFLDPLPSSLIIWHGSPEEAQSLLSCEPMSPEAKKRMLEIADQSSG